MAAPNTCLQSPPYLVSVPWMHVNTSGQKGRMPKQEGADTHHARMHTHLLVLSPIS